MKRAWEWIYTYVIPVQVLRLWWKITNPRHAYAIWKIDGQRPKVGGYATYHDEGPFLVTAVDGDELTFENGQRASWQNCCGPWPRKEEA